jgi:hypothetical protein
VHEYVVPGSKGNIERIEVSASQSQQNLCGQSEKHKGIIKTLIDDGQLAGLT